MDAVLVVYTVSRSEVEHLFAITHTLRSRYGGDPPDHRSSG